MTRLEITSLPIAVGAYPVSLAEAKAHAKIEVGDEDAEIQSWIKAATEMVEYGTQKKLVERKFRLFFDAGDICDDLITLEQFDSGLSIQAFTLFDDVEPTANETDVPAEDFLLLDHRIQLRNDFPDVSVRKYRSVKVEYTVSSAVAGEERLKEAVNLIIAHWFLNREAAVTDKNQMHNLPMGIINLIQSMRVPSA